MKEVENKISQFFPGAAPYGAVIEDYCRQLVNKHGMVLDKTIAAVSLCPDELNNPVINKVSELFGPCFHLGGLAGYPFTGVTGFNAFGGHIPDNGSAFIFFGPHVGIDDQSLGYVQRSGQQKKTLSCGAAIGAYQYLQQEKQKKINSFENDFQMGQLVQMINPHHEFFDKQYFEPNLVDILLQKSYSFVVNESKRIKDLFNVNSISLLGAIVINTPREMPDYLQVKYFESI